MYSKLSLRNIKRSVRDYTIYFLTITFAVCLFYSFNSLHAQQAMLKISTSQEDMLQNLTNMIGAISVFISVVLAFLIIYANGFLIRRRKKELGMYMTLGMSKFHISRILVIETLFIGLISLVIGIALGVLVSQGLSILTAALFEVDLKAYTFVFSGDATVKTILYFGIIFLFVMAFNVFIINRYKLIDLLTASKKNQHVKLRKTSTAISIFILSIILIGTAYSLMLKYGLLESMTLVWISVGLGAIGTFLFFFSLSGFLLNLFKKNEKLYYKDINMFVLRQINSKVNTTFISMTIICLMLFFTMGVLSTGFSLKNSLEKDLTVTTPYDATFYVYHYDEEQQEANDMFNSLQLEQYGDTVTYSEYDTGEGINSYLLNYADSESKDLLKGMPLYAIKQSSYQKLMELQGKDPISLKHDETLFLTNKKEMTNTIERFLNKENEVEIANKTYTIASEGYQFTSVKTDIMALEFFVAVLPDAVVKDMSAITTVANLQYDVEKQTADAAIYQTLETYNDKYQGDLYLLGMTKTLAYESASGTSTTVVYIGVYLGIVFLISSAAILALQQLSEASDNMVRYDTLKKIGVTKAEVNKSIFRQIFIYFMMPLSLAIIHSIFGIIVVNDALAVAGQASVLVPSLLTAGVIVLVYGGYFIATYSGYKSIVNNK
ncbi:ABC transporter permease [Paraliobacillus salinarum]|uniref:ABC transporter permease n=1 Tax=Paraliobacillus salinarum TaxID=1158996 RepID=UPI0015F4130A|nr:ABC transporter permease [Paraliobacillus salinarum]